jgi:hypothetical protein
MALADGADGFELGDVFRMVARRPGPSGQLETDGVFGVDASDDGVGGGGVVQVPVIAEFGGFQELRGFGQVRGGVFLGGHSVVGSSASLLVPAWRRDPVRSRLTHAAPSPARLPSPNLRVHALAESRKRGPKMTRGGRANTGGKALTSGYAAITGTHYESRRGDSNPQPPVYKDYCSRPTPVWRGSTRAQLP